MQNRQKNPTWIGRQQQIKFFEFFLTFAVLSLGTEMTYAY